MNEIDGSEWIGNRSARPPFIDAAYLRIALRAEALRLRHVLAEIEVVGIGLKQGWLSADQAFDHLERRGAIEFLSPDLAGASP